MELVDILVLGTSAERRAGSNPAEGKKSKLLKVKKLFIIFRNLHKSYFKFFSCSPFLCLCFGGKATKMTNIKF